VLWECQAGNHGAVELLRSQPAFWQALHACLPPNPGRLPAFDPEADLAEGAAAAWQLQAHASALHIVLLETVGQAPPPPPPSPRAAAGVGGGGEAARASAGAEAGADDGPPAAEAARQALLGALGPQDLSRLLLACAGGGQQPQLLAQLSALLQVCVCLGVFGVQGVVGVAAPCWWAREKPCACLHGVTLHHPSRAARHLNTRTRASGHVPRAGCHGRHGRLGPAGAQVGCAALRSAVQGRGTAAAGRGGGGAVQPGRPAAGGHAARGALRAACVRGGRRRRCCRRRGRGRR
jgi:hypothetical protein